jgi:hypothetical protein
MILRRTLLPFLPSRLWLALQPTSQAQEALLPPGITPTPPAERRVGIAYSTWHLSAVWPKAGSPNAGWGTPLLGTYASNDPRIIRQHALWLRQANVDFILVDWSNELGVNPAAGIGRGDHLFLENTTTLLFEEYIKLGDTPRISIMLGDGEIYHRQTFDLLQAKANQVYTSYVRNPKYSRLIETYLGKPLLVVFVGGDIEPHLPTWSDPRFTVRYMSAFVDSRSPAFSRGLLSIVGFWSWEDFGVPTYTVFGKHPEAMTVVAAFRGAGSPGRAGGQVFRNGWAQARRIGPKYVLAGTFNEWWVAEQGNPQKSKDIEPSKEWKFTYLDILAQQSALFKRGM